MSPAERQRAAHEIAASALQDWSMNGYALTAAQRKTGAYGCTCEECTACEEAADIARRFDRIWQGHEHKAISR